MCACGFVSIQAGITDGAIEAVAAQDKPSTPMNPLLQKGCSLRPWGFFQSPREFVSDLFECRGCEA